MESSTSGRGGGGRGGGGNRRKGRGRGRGGSNKDGGGRGNRRRGNNKQKEKAAQQAPPALSEEEKLKQEEAKKAAEQAALEEEERQRVAAEQAAAEAAKEALKQRQLDLNKQVKEAISSLDTVTQTTLQHKQAREAHSAENLAKSRKEFEASKKKLKSDLKKCTAFVKKIKSGSAWSMRPDDIQRDVAALNLSRYVEEVAAALVENKLKLADLPTVVALCSAMHERYANFLPAILPSMWSTIHGKATEETAKLRRIYLRLITEFLLHGIITETKQLSKTISEATGGADGSYNVTDATLVMSFVRAAGFEILGTTPRSIQDDLDLLNREVERAQELAASENNDAEATEEAVVIEAALVEKAQSSKEELEAILGERAVPEPVSDVFRTHCTGAYDYLATSLVATHNKLQKLEKRCEQDRLLSGTLTEAREKGLADARKLKDSLEKSVEVLSDVLVQPLPVLEEEEDDGEKETGVGLELVTKEGKGNDFGPFDDEETRAFYCDIPDLLTTVPLVLLGMTQDEVDRLQAENLVKYGEGSEPIVDEADSNEPLVASSEADFDAEEAAGQEEHPTDEDAVETGEGGEEENKDTPHYRLMVLLEQELPECNRREQVDEIAEKFIVNHGTSKNSRKRLSKTLFLVPRTRFDLLPFYSRVAAILDRVYPDVPSPLVTDLEQQFHGQAKFKKNQSIDSRMKTARYIGELTKFRVAPPIVALRCIRRCLDDFTGPNVDVACCLLESCGRFLYRTKHTNAPITALMDTMVRISKAKNLDERSRALINSAFYMVKPPPAAPRQAAKVYPPLEAYLRHLLLVKLVPTDSMVSFVSKGLLRFPWNDPAEQVGALICKYMMKACRKGRYKAIQAVAAVAAATRRSRPEIAARLIDAVLEDLQWSMEHPSFRDQQRTITYAKLLGELYSHSLVSGQMVIQQLYNFINFGHEIPDALRDASKKELENAAAEEGAGSSLKESLPVYNSSGGVSQTIMEDEEMEEAELETKEQVEPTKPQVVAVSMHSKYDPRVPCAIDPPNSVFRVKLVCTLLDSAAKHLMSKSNLNALDGFLAAFQRYLFTKTLLPTEVEFALLDTFDVVDSRWRNVVKDKLPADQHEKKDFGFPRYATWLDAHNATVAIEEADALHEQRAKTRLEAMAGLRDAASIDSDSVNELDSMMDEEEEESGDEHMSLDETDSEVDSQDGEASAAVESDEESNDGSSEDESEEDSQETDEDLEEYEEEEGEFDEEAYMQQLQEEEFERELRRLTMDALEKGKNTARTAIGGKVADVMPSGSQFIRKKPGEAESSGEPMRALSGQEGISFQLLKKGNKGKMEAKSFVVPSDTNLAKRATKQDDEAAKERELLKARVLEYEAESAEGGGGDVYLETEKLQVIRNRQLTMEDIDSSFGTTRGDYDYETAAAKKPPPNQKPPVPGSRRSAPPNMKPRSRPSGRGGARGRGGRGRSGRSLYF